MVVPIIVCGWKERDIREMICFKAVPKIERMNNVQTDMQRREQERECNLTHTYARCRHREQARARSKMRSRRSRDR